MIGYKKKEKNPFDIFLFFSIAQIFSGNVKTKLILSLQQQTPFGKIGEKDKKRAPENFPTLEKMLNMLCPR